MNLSNENDVAGNVGLLSRLASFPFNIRLAFGLFKQPVNNTFPRLFRRVLLDFDTHNAWAVHIDNGEPIAVLNDRFTALRHAS